MGGRWSKPTAWHTLSTNLSMAMLRLCLECKLGPAHFCSNPQAEAVIFMYLSIR